MIQMYLAPCDGCSEDVGNGAVQIRTGTGWTVTPALFDMHDKISQSRPDDVIRYQGLIAEFLKDRNYGGIEYFFQVI